jgi:hypothetical protein
MYLIRLKDNSSQMFNFPVFSNKRIGPITSNKIVWNALHRFMKLRTFDQVNIYGRTVLQPKLRVLAVACDLDWTELQQRRQEGFTLIYLMMLFHCSDYIASNVISIAINCKLGRIFKLESNFDGVHFPNMLSILEKDANYHYHCRCQMIIYILLWKRRSKLVNANVFNSSGGGNDNNDAADNNN